MIDRSIAVCWLETRTTRRFKLLDHRFETLGVERLVKWMILLTCPDRWDYAVRPQKRARVFAARDLCSFLGACWQSGSGASPITRAGS